VGLEKGEKVKRIAGEEGGKRGKRVGGGEEGCSLGESIGRSGCVKEKGGEGVMDSNGALLTQGALCLKKRNHKG